jgi:hypothetical protein
MANPLKKIGNAIGKLFPGTGRHAAQRAARDANMYAMQAQAQRAALEAKTKKEKARAQKLAIRGLRSRRAASRYSAESQGSPTIG